MRIRKLSRGDERVLSDFFSEVSSDIDSSRFFTPFPLNRETAAKIVRIASDGRDEYFAAFDADRILGFGMLRGWDEGYETPAFGVAVSPRYRGKGIGRALLRFATGVARSRNARRVMLKVHVDNTAARRLYESEGFVFEGRADERKQVRAVLELD